MVAKRDTIHVSPEFKKLVEEIQLKMLNNGIHIKDASVRIITDKIAKNEALDINKILNEKINNFDINIRMDRRKR